jgi:hypothetical protein
MRFTLESLTFLEAIKGKTSADSGSATAASCSSD